MSGTAISIITVLIALVLVVGGGLAYYMASLVKSAYELKIALNSEIDEKIRRIEEDMEKKSRWIKKELIDEVEKMKNSVQYDSARKIDDAATTLGRRISDFEEFFRKQQSDAAKGFEETRAAIMTLDQKLNVLRREQKKAQSESQPPAPSPPAANAMMPTQNDPETPSQAFADGTAQANAPMAAQT